MRKVTILLILVCSCSIMRAQIKSAKPSKAFTIKYLNEKLSQNCSGPSQKKEENLYGYNDGSGMAAPEISYRKVYDNQDYSITERGGVAYLSCKKIVQDKKVNFKDHSEDYDRTSDLLVEIPINKITDVRFSDIPGKREGKGDVIITYRERLMVIMTKDNDVLMKDLEKGTQQYTSGMVFPSFNLQDEDKMKNAFFNLKSYYKEEVDPFDNTGGSSGSNTETNKTSTVQKTINGLNDQINCCYSQDYSAIPEEKNFGSDAIFATVPSQLHVINIKNGVLHCHYTFQGKQYDADFDLKLFDCLQHLGKRVYIRWPDPRPTVILKLSFSNVDAANYVFKSLNYLKSISQ